MSGKGYIFAACLFISLILHCLFQDSRAYYHLLNQIAPKGDDLEQLPIKIDFTGFHVSLQKCKNRLELSETSVYVSNILVIPESSLVS